MQGGLRGTPPTSDKHPAGLAAAGEIHTASQERVQPVIGIEAGWRGPPGQRRGTKHPSARDLIFRGVGDHASNGHCPAWLRPSMLRKYGCNHMEIGISYQGR